MKRHKIPDDDRISFAEARKLAQQIYEQQLAEIQRHREEEAKRNHPLYGIRETIKEELAENAHLAWSGWMKYLFEKAAQSADGTYTIPKWAVDRWQRQMKTHYADLSKSEKDEDRKEAEKILGIIEPWI